MEANELRIGNYVYFTTLDIYTGNYTKITSMTNTRDLWNLLNGGSEIISKYEPISLTEEWLVKFGAVRDENFHLYIPSPHGENMRFYLVADFIQYTKSFHAPMINFEHIKSVHQLQNLYFALTGEELEIK